MKTHTFVILLLILSTSIKSLAQILIDDSSDSLLNEFDHLILPKTLNQSGFNFIDISFYGRIDSIIFQDETLTKKTDFESILNNQLNVGVFEEKTIFNLNFHLNIDVHLITSSINLIEDVLKNGKVGEHYYKISIIMDPLERTSVIHSSLQIKRNKKLIFNGVKIEMGELEELLEKNKTHTLYINAHKSLIIIDLVEVMKICAKLRVRAILDSK